MESFLSLKVSLILLLLVHCVVVHGDGIDDLQPLSKIAIHRALFAFHVNASLKAEPVLLGTKGEDFQWITVELDCPDPSGDDWVAVFSPAKFKAYVLKKSSYNGSSSTCPPVILPNQEAPHLCSAPIKYKFANDSNAEYTKTGKASLKFRLINQRADFSMALFSGGLSTPKLLAVSNTVTFANPKAPVYPRLSQGKSWNEMAVTWTSGYNIIDAVPFVEWGFKGEFQTQSPAGTLTFHREAMCGPPARTIGWRDPGYIHTSFLKDLWPNSLYTYKLGHRLFNGSYIWSKSYYFKSSPYPGQDSLQRVVIFGDMGKAERDGSNDSNEDTNYQPGSLNTTDQLIKDLDNIDILFHIGDITYANGYISQWDQFTSQVEPIASTIPYMIASGNHERDVPGTGSFFETNGSGGPPARTIGWRDPGYIHTSLLKDLWPNSLYTYKLGHRLFNGSYIWSKSYYFKSSPYPGQDSLQRVVIFGDMGKAERDGSNEYTNLQPGSLNTTDQLIKDLDNIDILFHIGDITYANGYISQWDQFTSQVEPIASTIPYMIASGNHERDVPGTGSFFETNGSGGECGVLAETMFYVPAENRAKFWEGSEQYKFIEKCLASADRQKQPWLIFAAHRVLGYSSDYWKDGSYGESMGRESLQKLWQKYKVDIAFYGHVHNYERTCPIYQVWIT
ncbi:putative inactive purple acid phosphatase 27 [Quercus suber]|uniref:Purple acid phosphatase n=1 Tax=Quercus suber TaxID=58331 RepID=A0AAW0JBI4_QUESU